MYKKGQEKFSRALNIKITATARFVTFHEEKRRQLHAVEIKLKEFI
jgi:hypothetical protein